MIKTVAKKILPKPVSKYIYESIHAPITYNEDRLKTRANADFLRDPKFRKAYAAAESTGSWYGSQVQWRVYVHCWAADIGSRLEGDFIECGVNTGGWAMAAADYVEFEKLNKKFFLLDTYEGYVEEYITPEEKAQGRKPGGPGGRYTPCYDQAVKNFSRFGDKAVLIKGAIPETLDQIKTDKIAYASIDMNCVIPEIAAAEFLWPKMVRGAIMVLDDYGWSGHYEQKKAFDKFAAEHSVMVLAMPTGQGIIIKP